MPRNVAADTVTGGNDLTDAQLIERLADLRRQVEENCEPEGPIREALVPSLRATMQVVDALLTDGQPEVAIQVLEPVAKEVKRILERGY